MRIYEMTATFGKLDHETLILRPGLNIIEAPNEWGKSTWCAFLISMLYGVDTRAKTTKTALSDKEHYAPWSGRPMSGSMKLRWQGKDITIERSTRGRIPMGEFSAYETESGIPVPELTAENCGEVLLGVECSVFKRSGFVRLTDLPISRDDALRRRLNALVTTGDESGDGEQLARELKALKNRCRYNKTGLLPQAEAELSETRQSMEELRKLQSESAKLSARLEENQGRLQKLRNHLSYLKNQEASQDALRVRQAKDQLEEARQRAETLRESCRQLPPQEQLEQKLRQIEKLSEDMDELLERQRNLPEITPAPVAPTAFSHMTPTEALEQAKKDQKRYEMLQLNFLIVWILAAVCCAAASVLFFALKYTVTGVLFLILTMAFLAGSVFYQKFRTEKLWSLTEKYGDENPENWIRAAEYYLKTAQSYERDGGQSRNSRNDLNCQLERLKNQRNAICGQLTISETLQKFQKVIQYREALCQAEKDQKQAENHLTAVLAMAKKAQSTQGQDDLFLTEEETCSAIDEIESLRQSFHERIGQYQGRMEALGTEDRLVQKEKALKERIQKLEIFYEALSIAQCNLEEAAAQLQRRFVPRIVQRARELMGRMTDGKYEKLTLEEDFSLNAGAGQEDILRSTLWRSDGTADQLYLALRLAVSEALSPEAPLVLDDALVRFDGARLDKTLQILQKEEKQVILFTCQSREGTICPQAVIRKE